MANIVTQIPQFARLYAAVKGYSLSTVSLRIDGQGNLFARLQNESADLTIGRRDRALQWFSDNCPRLRMSGRHHAPGAVPEKAAAA